MKLIEISLIELNNMTKELGLTGCMNYYCFISRVGWKLLENDGDTVERVKWINKNMVV